MSDSNYSTWHYELHVSLIAALWQILRPEQNSPKHLAKNPKSFDVIKIILLIISERQSSSEEMSWVKLKE